VWLMSASSADRPGDGAPGLACVLNRRLSETELENLAKALFEESERITCDGLTWEDQDSGDRAYYRNCVRSVLRGLSELSCSQR
jgi:hypothetical protein